MKIGLALSLLLVSSAAMADIFDVPKVQSVFNRKYEVKDEVTAQLGYLPKGAFSKYLAIGGSYTHAFSDFTSWEIINALYTPELASGLKKQLLADPYFFSPDLFAVETFQVTSNITFSPIYTKNLLFNSSIVYSQFSVVVGAGIAHFNVGIVPLIDAGVVLRFFLPSKNFLKFDLRYNKFLTTNQTVNDNYTVIFGYSFNLSRKGEFGD